MGGLRAPGRDRATADRIRRAVTLRATTCCAVHIGHDAGVLMAPRPSGPISSLSGSSPISRSIVPYPVVRGSTAPGKRWYLRANDRRGSPPDRAQELSSGELRRAPGPDEGGRAHRIDPTWVQNAHRLGGSPGPAHRHVRYRCAGSPPRAYEPARLRGSRRSDVSSAGTFDDPVAGSDGSGRTLSA
jgi:hypothetical protein